jgi:hypothetical protein
MSVMLPRPRLRRAKYYQILVSDPIHGWSCEGAGLHTFGVIPQSAYEQWETELLARTEERRKEAPPRRTFTEVFDELFRDIFGGKA